MTFENKLEKIIGDYSFITYGMKEHELELRDRLDAYLSAIIGVNKNPKIFNKNSDKLDYKNYDIWVNFSQNTDNFIRVLVKLISLRNNDSQFNTLMKIKALLKDKNEKYGNAALEPLRMFAKADAQELIKVRIDDKLNRIRQSLSDEDEDVYQDLLGYLILLKITENYRQE